MVALGLGPLAARALGTAGRKVGRRQPLVWTEKLAPSICQLCPSGCGLRVRLVNGNPVSIHGNPLHPVNRGGLCGRGAAGLQLYYDPDRFTGPLRRDDDLIGKFGRTTWPAALGDLSSRVRYAAEAGPGRVAVIRGGGRSLASELLGRLVRAAGSDWVIDVGGGAGAGAADEVLRQMYGTTGRLVFDLANADFLLSIESGLCESPTNTMTFHRGLAALRAAGGRMVHAEPRLGVTGSKADEWLPIRPGTAGVLALGVAHMLIKEGFARSEFLETHVRSFDDWTDESGATQPGIRSWILRTFSPQRVAEVTGVDWERIIRVARAFGSARRPLAVGPVDVATPFQTFDLMAVHTLNAIVGAIDVSGGVLLGRQPPFPALDAPFDPTGGPAGAEVARGRRGPTLDEFCEQVLGGRSPPITVCIVHEADPVFWAPNGHRVAEALRKVPLLVSTSPVATDTTECADLILPDALWIERRSDSVSVDADGYPVVAMSPAAARRRADSRDTADVVLEVARQAGERVARHFPWRSYDEVLRDRIGAIDRSRVGDTFSDEHGSTWAQLLERSGWRSASYGNAEELAKRLDESGGWWEPAYHHGEWRRLSPHGEHRIDLRPVERSSEPDALRRPQPPFGDKLSLYVHPELALGVEMGGSLPYLQDIGSPLTERGWETTVEINAATALRLGISHGDRVTLRNDRGVVTAVARLSQGIRPEVIAIHTGGGRVRAGRFAAGVGANPMVLVATRLEPGTGLSRIEPTFVEVRRV